MEIILLNQTKNKYMWFTAMNVSVRLKKKSLHDLNFIWLPSPSRLSPCVTLLAFLLCLEHSLEIPLCLFDFTMGFKLVQRANILLILKLHAKDNQW